MDQVLNFLNQNIKLNQNDTIVLAVSGGIDSMCLLSFLKKHYPLVNIVCAHVHHNVRKESDEEAVFVESYCHKHSIIFEMLKIEKYEKGYFTELEARKIRYDFFEKLINEYQAKYLFTAHHGDDLVETILMKIVRGSNFYGYRGFSAISKRDNYQIVRPFICITKDIIKQYVVSNSIPYREDISNLSLEYTRNRYRNQIIPLLKENNDHLVSNFLMFNQTIEEYYNFINQYVLTNFDTYFQNNKLDIKQVIKFPVFVRKQLIFYCLDQIYKDSINQIKTNHVDNILSLLSNNKVNCYINLPNNYICVKEYDYLSFIINISHNDYKIEITKETIIPNGKIIKKLDQCDDTDNNVIYLNSKDVKLPLYVRNRREGDRICVKNMNHRKKVKDIFIEHKISANKRKEWPIVVDSKDNIVWIPGLKKSNLDSQKSGKYDIILKYT